MDGEYRPDTATLPEIADKSLECLRQAVTSVEVTARREIGSGDVPGLMQTLAVSTRADGVRRDLVQTQVYLSMLAAADPHAALKHNENRRAFAETLLGLQASRLVNMVATRLAS